MSPSAPNPFEAMMSFGKMMPGFEFMQGWVNQADRAMPHLGQWVAPTLDPQELDKRIHDLKAVQFWLDQNARMLAATIQALEVQKMTLATLQTMNVSMGDLKAAMRMPPVPGFGVAASEPEAASPSASTASPSPQAETETETPQEAEARAAAASQQAREAAEASVKPALDAMKLWSALSQQFAQMATSSLGDGFGAAAAAAGARSSASPPSSSAASSTAKSARKAAPKAAPEPAPKVAPKAAPKSGRTSAAPAAKRPRGG